MAQQRSALLEVFDSDMGTLVLARLDIYAQARLYARVSKWFKSTGWVPARAAALSPVQKKLVCDSTPFIDKAEIGTVLHFGPAWLVEAFVKELKAKQTRYKEPEEKALREQHAALATRRRNIRVIKSALERYHTALDTHNERLQRELEEVRQEYESERQNAGQQIADLTDELHRLESAALEEL